MHARHARAISTLGSLDLHGRKRMPRVGLEVVREAGGDDVPQFDDELVRVGLRGHVRDRVGCFDRDHPGTRVHSGPDFLERSDVDAGSLGGTRAECHRDT